MAHENNTSDAELESLLVPTKWTDRDAEMVAQSEIDGILGLGTVDSLD
ncbi:MAG: hypothetical protein IS632_08770 [Thaumarchaeota archaeon]|nr:hypothetical protein [Nitrososphaerota archaeon]